MDTSSPLDIFSISTNASNSQEFPMDTVLFDSLVRNIKRALSEKINGKMLSATQFSSILDDCRICISQVLDNIKNTTEQSYSNQMIMAYLEDSASVVQLLSNYTKKNVESLTFTYSHMKEFPVAVGDIILLVFNHCKDSEIIYGSKLSLFEITLKNLFRSCHELQITYLMILEKNFLFDLSNENEIDILLQALNINLKIGAIVQSLDVKTMAEQWKAITAICEKYCTCLIDRNIYNECVQVVSVMITNNVNTALENMNEDKVVTRALKVASFTLKILLKICTILRNNTVKQPLPLIDLLIYIHLHCATEVESKKSVQFMHLLDTYVVQPSGNLICELLADKLFFESLFNYNYNKEDEQLAFILLMITVMKCIAQNPEQYINISKSEVIRRIYEVLPHCHLWFNLPMRYKCINERTIALYEHLLVHTVVFACTLNGEQYSYLERTMYESILGTECYRALFFTDLWGLLARLSNRQLTMNQLVYLCNTYQRLEGNNLFYHSPQNVHLKQIISMLFKDLTCEEKIRFYNQFDLIEANYEIWTAIGVKNLPDCIRNDVEVQVVANCRRDLHKLVTSSVQSTEFYNMIRTLKLTASCAISDDSLNKHIVRAFTKTCSKHNRRACMDYAQTKWFERFIEALVSLSISIEQLFYENANVMKVLHAISHLIQMNIAEINLLLIDLICKIIEHVKQDVTLNDVLRNLFKDNNSSVKHKVLTTLYKNINNNNVRSTVERIINEDISIKEIWETINKKENTISTKLIEDLKATIDYKFIHKCIDKTYLDTVHLSESAKNLEKKTNSNFDFADIDTLFETESDNEPETKKIKLGSNETALIVSRLEKDVDLLLTVKENTIDHKHRIKTICDKLLNIIK